MSAYKANPAATIMVHLWAYHNQPKQCYVRCARRKQPRLSSKKKPIILVPEVSSDAESKIELSGENCVL